MPVNGTYTFGKKEHLCKRTLIDQLFVGDASQLKAWPLRLVYVLRDKQEEQEAAVQVLVSVSKRCFKRAVKRNRVKRQIRESFRLQRESLMQTLAQYPQKQLLMAFLWQDDKLHDTELVSAKVKKLLDGLSQKVAGYLSEASRKE